MYVCVCGGGKVTERHTMMRWAISHLSTRCHTLPTAARSIAVQEFGEPGLALLNGEGHAAALGVRKIVGLKSG